MAVAKRQREGGSVSVKRPEAAASAGKAPTVKAKKDRSPVKSKHPKSPKAPKALCIVCGVVSLTECSACRAVTYCGKACQTKHWKDGHRNACATLSGGARKEAAATAVPAPASRKAASRERRKKEQDVQRHERKRNIAEAAELKLAGSLIDGPIGCEAPRPLPLRHLVRSKAVAWQWMGAGGKMVYPIPIGSTRPLSPFRSSDSDGVPPPCSRARGAAVAPASATGAAANVIAASAAAPADAPTLTPETALAARASAAPPAAEAAEEAVELGTRAERDFVRETRAALGPREATSKASKSDVLSAAETAREVCVPETEAERTVPEAGSKSPSKAARKATSPATSPSKAARKALVGTASTVPPLVSVTA